MLTLISHVLTIDRSFHTASSAEADALILAHGAGLADDMAVNTYGQSAYRHFKAVAAWSDGVQLLANAGADAAAAGAVVSDKADKAFAKLVVASLADTGAGNVPQPTDPTHRKRNDMPNGIDLILADPRTVDSLFAQSKPPSTAR